MGYDRRMGVKERSFASLRKKLERDRELAAEDLRKRLRIQRLEYARAGISAYHKRRLGDAARAFKSYINALEELNGVSEGGLKPSHFDTKLEQPELLMLSGVYWDLVKLYDRTRTEERKRDFIHYLQKYVEFSKGMPYQHLCAEALRKYIVSQKPKHREEFKAAYRALSLYKCFVASSLVDVTNELTLPRLRYFRDQVLAKFRWGRKFINWYYKNGPSLGERAELLPNWIRHTLGKALDLIAKLVSMNYRP